MKIDSNSGRLTFAQRYCQITGCKPEHFEYSVLLDCRHKLALFPHWLALKFMPQLLDEDMEIIRGLGQSSSYQEFLQDYTCYRHRYPIRGWWRSILKVRLSGRRMLHLGKEVFLKPKLVEAQSSIWQFKNMQPTSNV